MPHTSTPAFDLVKPSKPVSNLEFLHTLFRNIDSDACAWVCLYGGDPGQATSADWAGFGARPGDPYLHQSGVLDRGAEKMNTFTTFSSFRGEVGIHDELAFPGRRKTLFAAAHAVMIDDVGVGLGAKISPERLPAASPSWVLETSPGNWQVGYLLREPEREAAKVAALLDALVHEGLQEKTDPGMKGVTRYGRLPVGMNGKQKYRDAQGDCPAHRLLHWQPQRRFTLAAVGALFGIDQGQLRAVKAVPTATRARAGGEDEDPWLEVLRLAVGRVEGPDDKGSEGVWYHCTCPWVGEHTGDVDNGSAYLLGGGYKCHHGHCIDRGWPEVRAWLLAHEDPQVQAAAIAVYAGELLESGPELGMPQDPRIEIEECLQARALELLPAGTSETREAVVALLRDIAGADLSTIARDTLLDDVAQASTLTKTTVRAQYKQLEQETREEARRARAVAQEDARGQRVSWPILLPGDWRDQDEEGKPRPTSRNIEVLVQQAHGWIRYNEMTGSNEYRGALEGKSGDWVITFLSDACEINGLRSPTSNKLVGMVRRIAEDESYHPFREFLEGLEPWDGEDRLRGPGGLFATVIVAREDLELRNLILERWFRSVIAAARHTYRGMRGCQPRGVLVFLGEQLAGKTTWLGRLVEGLFPGSEECFLEGAHYSGDTDSKLSVTGALITELGEIDSTLNRAEMGMLKAFLSGGADRLRKPYGYEHENRFRRTVFAGTVNREEFLRDMTGNTRFWTIRCTAPINLDAQRRVDIRQVWAQVQEEVRQGMKECERAEGYRPLPWHMSPEESKLIEASNDSHRVRSPEERLLMDRFEWDDPAYIKGSAEERMRINPMRYTEIYDACCGSGGRGRPGTGWSDALRLLTGQAHAKDTSVVLKDADGKKYVKRGKLYAMPPQRNLRENFDALPPPEDEKVH